MGWKTEMAIDVAEWSFAYESLKMASQSAERGFGVPFAGMLHGKAGLRTKGFGAIGRGVGFAETESQIALRMYERGGIKGYGKVAKHLGASSKFSTQVASKVGSRYILGRAAGIALRGANVFLWATLGFEVGKGVWDFASAQEKKYKGLELGGDWQDTQAGATSRQRALRAITASSLQARSAIGNEAMLMHR